MNFLARLSSRLVNYDDPISDRTLLRNRYSDEGTIEINNSAPTGEVQEATEASVVPPDQAASSPTTEFRLVRN